MREHLEETLRRILAEALARDVKDPRLSLVTITEVRLNRDGSVAQVFYTDMNEGGPDPATARGLRSSRGFLRQIVGDRLRLRTVPELRFRYDDSLDRSFRVDELLGDSLDEDAAD